MGATASRRVAAPTPSAAQDDDAEVPAPPIVEAHTTQTTSRSADDGWGTATSSSGTATSTSSSSCSKKRRACEVVVIDVEDLASQSSMAAQAPAASAPAASASPAAAAALLRLPLYLTPPPMGSTMREHQLEELATVRMQLLAKALKAGGSSPAQTTALADEDATGDALQRIWRSAASRSGDEADAAAVAAAGTASQAELAATHDACGHFLLRLALCKTHALREWLLFAELALLRQRWCRLAAFPGAQGEVAQRIALSECGFVERRGAVPPRSLNPEGWHYEVPFAAVPRKLLGQRRVLLRGGTALVPLVESFELLEQAFAGRLRASLEEASSQGEQIPKESFLGAALLRLQALGEKALVDYGDVTGEVGVGLSLQNFEDVLEKSFPPCMKQLVLSQRGGRHLKHQGRLQLRPFLREAGLDMDSAKQWWYREMLRDPKVTTQMFANEHMYHIEHAYGKRGRCRKAFGFGCRTLGSWPGPGSTREGISLHGCPFASWRATAAVAADVEGADVGGGGEATVFRRLLELWSAPPTASAGLLEMVQRGDAAGKCCSEFFKACHPGASEEVLANVADEIKHPNQYLRCSRQHHGGSAVPMPEMRPVAAAAGVEAAEAAAASAPSAAAPAASSSGDAAYPSPALGAAPHAPRRRHTPVVVESAVAAHHVTQRFAPSTGVAAQRGTAPALGTSYYRAMPAAGPPPPAVHQPAVRGVPVPQASHAGAAAVPQTRQATTPYGRRPMPIKVATGLSKLPAAFGPAR
eukprot:TRINITY_DN58943_c0_g1_i1.p1 TRINITY_DN58943_c0_g1~~TRINITY_DN58943_c0_g1_i1.p1  ORF type:complete len:756 (-),score=160.45 TRINITY_DN58943_c0_g1_i1:144-2411(-)